MTIDEIEIGKWYRTHDNRLLYNAVSKTKKDFNAYGWAYGTWIDGDSVLASRVNPGNFVLAADTDVRISLKREAKKRGLYKNTKISEVGTNIMMNTGTFVELFTPTTCWNNNGIIFQKGVWAEPLKEPIETTTKDNSHTFKVGDRVRFVKQCGDPVDISIDKVGTVRKIGDDPYPICVDMGDYGEHNFKPEELEYEDAPVLIKKGEEMEHELEELERMYKQHQKQDAGIKSKKRGEYQVVSRKRKRNFDYLNSDVNRRRH